MCGIAAAVDGDDPRAAAAAMVAYQRHRGPDAQDLWSDHDARVALGHDRLAIRDLSDAGIQPMHDESGRFVISFNGEILNDAELRSALEDGYRFRSRSDTEVLLAAWARWGEACLERLVGFFAFLIYDRHERTLWAVRDRFGVKPLYLHRAERGGLLAASEIGALFAGGAPRDPDRATWAGYLGRGVHDEGRRTFWRGIERVEAGSLLRWQGGTLTERRWYDLAARATPEDGRHEDDVEAEYRALLEESVRLRFRSDVPVGINLSGGLDSSTLLAIVHAVQGQGSAVSAFTFVCGDPAYDELPWVERMLRETCHPLVTCSLGPELVPALAADVMAHQHEPFGGIPTLAYARVFEEARRRGIIVLLDGQGMDEQWAGYDYYGHAVESAESASLPSIQGTRQSPVRPHCMTPELRRLGRAEPRPPDRGGDRLRDLQLRDITTTKLPRALRFNDRVSMRASCELREPFLDHRLVELALRQPAGRKITADGTRKAMLRRIASDLLPTALVDAPKRPVQTPQREWLRGPLRDWAEDMITSAQQSFPGWLDQPSLAREWASFLGGEVDNGFFVWQWISLGLASGVGTPAAEARA